MVGFDGGFSLGSWGDMVGRFCGIRFSSGF